MDKLKQILTDLYYKIDALYSELSDLDCDLFVTEQMENQIKELLSLYDQFKQEISALHHIDWDDTTKCTSDEITLFLPIIDAWTLVQVIDEQLFNGTINVETLKEFDDVMEQIRMVNEGWLV
jgi:Ni,Fe-hydrogenase maturation factor